VSHRGPADACPSADRPGASWPEPQTELVARDEVARTFQQKREDLEALFLKADPDARLPQLA
jgi:hypothetical protein